MLAIAQLHSTSGNRIAESTIDEQDDKKETRTFLYDKKTRDKINSVVSAGQATAFRRTYSFYGLHVVNDEQAKEVSRVANETDAKLKEIDPNLRCYCSFFPIDEERIRHDKVYEQVALSMKQQIYSDAIKRLDKIAGKQLNPRMKTALLDFVQKLKEINVFNDTEVNNELDRIKSEIERERIPEIKKELEGHLENIDRRLIAFTEQMGE